MKKLLKNIFIPIVALALIIVPAAMMSPTPVFAAATLVQTAQGGYGYVNNFSQAMGSNTTAGCTLIAEVTAGDANTVSSFNDTGGNSWGLIASDLNTSQRQTWMYYAYNIVGGADTINVTWGSGQFADANIIIREYCGLTTTNPLDVSAHANDGGNFQQTHTTGTTGVTTQASELVVVAAGAPDSAEPGWSVSSPYGNLVHQKGFDAFTYGAMADNIVSTTGTQTATFNTTDFVVAQGIIATFKVFVAPTAPASFFGLFGAQLRVFGAQFILRK